MKNEIKCPGCNTVNPSHQLNCTNCNSYLRGRVVNIDLWKTFAVLTYSPREAFTLIRDSEHKNFLLMLFIFIVLKMFPNSIFLSLAYYIEPDIFKHFLLAFGVVAGAFLALNFLFAYMLKFIAKMNGIKIRFWDNISLFLYSFFPYLIGLIILLPLEYIVFGEYLFSRNPSWFVLNSSFAYLFIFLEASLLLWNGFLLFCAVKLQTNSKLFSVSFSLVFIFITYLTYFVVSKYLFM
jgi:Yip1 domain.